MDLSSDFHVASIANYLPFNVTLSRSDPMRSLFDICSKNIVPRFNLDFLYTTITMGVDPGYVKENFYDKVDFLITWFNDSNMNF